MAAAAALGNAARTVALLSGGDRFEDFYDKIGTSLETFRTRPTGGWLFNYVDALKTAGVDTLLVFASTRVDNTVRFRHEPTGCRVVVLRSPVLHQKARAFRWRYARRSPTVRSLESYLATPARTLARELRLHSCQAVLCQEYETPRFDLAVLLGRALRLPVFATYQGASGEHSALEAVLRPLSLRRCAGLIIGAQRERDRVLRRYRFPDRRLAPIPNPVEFTEWHPVERGQARRALGIPHDACVVIWHGRVQIPRKGLDVLLTAWRQVYEGRTAGTRPLLLLVGSGTNAAELAQRISTLPPGSVRWIDEFVRDRRRLWQYLSAADVGVLSSRHEGFPVAAVEAMACGLPLVASDVTGVRDIVGEPGERSGGSVVAPEDPDALATALSKAIGDPDWRRRVGQAARFRSQEMFSLHAVGRELADVLFPHS